MTQLLRLQSMVKSAPPPLFRRYRCMSSTSFAAAVAQSKPCLTPPFLHQRLHMAQNVGKKFDTEFYPLTKA